MMATNVLLLRRPVRWGSLLWKLGPIYVVSLYLFKAHNTLINWEVVLTYLQTSIFIETPSLEGLPTKANEDLSPDEIRLSLDGHETSIS